MSTRQKLTGVFVLGVVAGLVWWCIRSTPGADMSSRTAAPAADILYWYDPMRPEVHFDKPGPSPFMDMALVPKYRAAVDAGGISIDPRVVQNLGVRTAAAVQSTVAPRVTVTGTVAVDERRLAVVTSRAAGWIESLDVRATGDPVQRGRRIAGLYSPELLAAQEEYLLVLSNSDQVLASAARRRLVLLGVPQVQLDRIAHRGTAERQVDILAPIGGVVTDIMVREGAAVSAGATLVDLADLSRVWVIAEVPEAQGAWLKPGLAAIVTPATGSAEPIQGRVDYLYPEVTAATRTLRVRIALENGKMQLKPGLSARVSVDGEPRAAVLIPTEALIRSGNRTVVILAESEGRFRPVAVEPGAEQGDRTEIRAGLKAGDKVVVSGQFLLDSEANLRGALDRLLPGAGR